MSIFYKLQFNKEFTILELDEIVERVNDLLVGLGISIMDFNLEAYEDDKLIEADGHLELSWKTGNKKFDFASGYINFSTHGEYDYFFKNFKKIIKANFSGIVIKVMVQRLDMGGVIEDKNFVEIPD